MKVCVMGSVYKEGVSKKNGKPYKAFITHVVYEDNGGKKVKEAFINPEFVGGVAPLEGDVMDLDFGFGGSLNSAKYLLDEKCKLEIFSVSEKDK